MIDLVAVLFSTTMVLVIIVRAIKADAASNTRPEGISHRDGLKDRTNLIDRGPTS